MTQERGMQGVLYLGLLPQELTPSPLQGSSLPWLALSLSEVLQVWPSWPW